MGRSTGLLSPWRPQLAPQGRLRLAIHPRRQATTGWFGLSFPRRTGRRSPRNGGASPAALAGTHLHVRETGITRRIRTRLHARADRPPAPASTLGAAPHLVLGEPGQLAEGARR